MFICLVSTITGCNVAPLLEYERLCLMNLIATVAKYRFPKLFCIVVCIYSRIGIAAQCAHIVEWG